MRHVPPSVSCSNNLYAFIRQQKLYVAMKTHELGTYKRKILSIERVKPDLQVVVCFMLR